MATTKSTSITARKLDLFYFVFFLVHIPIVVFIDLVPFYPPSIVPKLSLDLRQYSIDNYRDKYFIQTPPYWFTVFGYLEALYHLPISLWFVGALVRDDPLMPLQLLIFGMETAVTTLVCVVEMLEWEGYTTREIGALWSLYVPYLCIALLMTIDSFFRIKKVLLRKTKNE